MTTIKTPHEIAIMAEGGKMLAQVLRALRAEVRPGIETLELDKLAHRLIKEADAEPAFLNYRPTGSREAYPFTLCASLNDCVVHGRPSKYKLQEGDVLKLDLGLKHKGFYLDSAITVAVGEISQEALKLIKVTEESLAVGIKQAKAGKTVGDIGAAIQKFVEKNGFSVVRTLTGHGIGRELHEDPQVLNFGYAGDGEKLEVGMVIAIEPMVAIGSGATKTLADDSFVTTDGSLAVHFEHTVAITERGPMVLTK
ncbi:MAG: type I methionyl aminopeptidase [Patescibacteria group bacterium]